MICKKLTCFRFCVIQEEKQASEGDNFKSYAKMLIKFDSSMGEAFFAHIGYIDFNANKLNFKVPIVFDQSTLPAKFRVLGPGLLSEECKNMMELKISS